MSNTTPLLTIFDSFVRPFTRESHLRTSALTNTDQVNKIIKTTEDSQRLPTPREKKDLPFFYYLFHCILT